MFAHVPFCEIPFADPGVLRSAKSLMYAEVHGMGYFRIVFLNGSWLKILLCIFGAPPVYKLPQCSLFAIQYQAVLDTALKFNRKSLNSFFSFLW